VIRLRRVIWAEIVARMEAIRNDYIILVGKTEKKRPLVRSRYRWEDNVRMNLGEIWLRIGTSGEPF
jgi:hypothetical protein